MISAQSLGPLDTHNVCTAPSPESTPIGSIRSTVDNSASSTAFSKPRRLVFHPLTFNNEMKNPNSKSATPRRISISGPLRVQTTNEYLLSSKTPTFTRSASSLSYGSSRKVVSSPCTGLVLNNATLIASAPSACTIFNRLDNELRKSYSEVDFCDGCKVTVPTIVSRCIQFLEFRDPVEGVFRINGSIRKIKSIETAIQRQGIDSFRFEDFTFENNETPNCYDVAMVLKRWLANLENGLITSQINAKLKRDRMSSKDDMFDEADEPREEEQNTSRATREEEDTTLVDLSTNTVLIRDQNSYRPHNTLLSNTISDSPNSSMVSSVTTDSDSNSPKFYDFTARRLSELPIENLHLFLYLLKFLNRMTADSIVHITKMTATNLAKIFQLSFFKSDDLLSKSVFTNTDCITQSSEDLLQSYKTNEEILHNLISAYPNLCKDLIPTLRKREHEMEDLLTHPADPLSKVPIARPSMGHSKSLMLDKASKRKSMFGYRSFSNMFNASSFSLSSSSRKSSWGSDKTQEDTKESEITPAVKLNFSIAQKQQKDTIVIPKRSERRKSETSIRNISAPVSNPLLEEDSSTVDDQSNIRSTSFSRKASVRARRGHRKRPQSMFIERRLSSLFNPAGSNEDHQDQNDYPHHHHRHHHHRLSVQRYDNEDQPKASSFHPHRRVSSLASDKENRLMNEDATDGSLRKTKSKFFGWFQRQGLSLS